MVDRPKRVPPPPPPGFGDEDYYKLYGEPEEYQRYRRELTEKLKWKGDSPPQHEEYSVYRRYKSYEESYDYYCGPRQGELDGREAGRVPPKRRIAPPPPPGFEDSPAPKGAKTKKRIAPPAPSPSRRGGKKGEEEGSASGSEACEVFKNFRVTIKNDSDGTPSLSDSDEELDKRGKRKRKRKRKEREREKRKKLEKKLKKREEELKAVKEKRLNSEPDLRDEIMQRRDESAGKNQGKKLSVIERLGERPPPGGDRADLRDRRLGKDEGKRGRPEARGGRRSPIRPRASQETTRREDLVRRAELRKDKPDLPKNNRDRGSLGRINRSASPRKNRGRPDSRNIGRRRKSLSLGRKSKSTGRRSRSPAARGRSNISKGNRSKSIGSRSKSKGNIRRNSKSKDRRSLSDLRKKRSISKGGRSLSKGRNNSRNRRLRNRSRTPLKRAGDRRGNAGRGRRKKKKRKRKRGDLSRNDKLRLEDMKEENEEMQAKLQEKRKKGGGNAEGLLGRLADMAGTKIPDTFKSKDGKSRKSGSQSGSSSSGSESGSSGSSSEDEYDSESGSESDEKGGRKRGNSGKRDKRFFWEKEAGKLKSDVVKKVRKNSEKSAKDNEFDRKDLKRSPDLKKTSGDKWKHDKFMDIQKSPEAFGSPSGHRKEAFGSHWSKIRSERSKERERNKSSRSKSRTRSRSRSTRKSRKRKRRGKFSRSHSSSDSSRSRSWSSSRHSSYSSRSRTKSRSKSPTKKKGGSSPGTATTSKKAKDPDVVAVEDEKGDKEGVNLGLSGALTADSNTVNGVVVKYCEPQEARKPKKKWRLYVFKGNEELPILYIHRQSAYLLGRDRKVADVPLDHPSCSKQHAALQYRLVNYTREDGTAGRRVQLYVIDLGSANGTFVNNSRIESQKYIQLLEKDVLKFGFSSREYVLLHDQSKVDLAEEDDGLD